MDKYKKLMSNTLIFAIGQLGAKLLSFFLVRLYTAQLTEAEYGISQIFYDTINVLFPIVTLSMSDAIIRFGMDSAYNRNKVYTSANTMTLLGMTVFAVTTPIWNHISVYRGYTFLLYVYCFFSCFRALASQYVRAKGLVRLFATDGILATLTIFISNLIFMKGLNLGIKGYILSFIVSDFLSLVYLSVCGRLNKSFDTKFISPKLIKEMLRFSAPLIPTYLLWWITSSSDKWFVLKLVSKEENGLYSLAYKLPTLLLMVTQIFFNAWQMSSIEERDSRTIGKFYQKVYGAYSSVIFIAGAFLIIFANPLTALLTPKDSFMKSSLYTVILIEAMVFQCMCHFLSSIYSVRKKSVNSLLTALVAALVNIVLNIILIPKFQVYGAAIATAASYFACFAVRIVDARKYIPFRVEFAKLGVNIMLITVLAIVSVNRDKLYPLWALLLFAMITVINISAVINTAKRILSRRKTGAAGIAEK